ncbi:MAG: TraV family lipoprotein [Alphaproteobacteria bacterium]|nr:TraV family lipoprotein [Alphaproteobacteria bacterium]
MTNATKRARRLAPLPVATLGVLLLAGCSSGNIGESWQCPLAKGGSCDSVAAADPAVPDMDSRTVLGEPLWRVRGDELPEVRAETRCATECDGGFDPFAWLARLFGDPGSPAGAGGNDGGDERSTAGHPEPATAAKTETLPAGPDREADAAASSAAAEAAEFRSAEPAAATLPAEPAAAEDDPQANELRTGEVVARIWIAPFVDADGVYREASHVRVVLEPAGWRLP